MYPATLIGILLALCQACLAETLPEGQFSVSVISSSGKPVDVPQVYLVTKEGIFQEEAAGKDGLFT